jgi:pyruvate/2-oxoglutarate/acetoin dehydrogenase E1 component
MPASCASMTGGDAEMPVVFIIEMTGQTPGFAGQHSDYEIDTYYAHIPGVKTVIPSNPTDAKGMMVSALRDPRSGRLSLSGRPSRHDRGCSRRAIR